jgi:hypothetical protein
VKDEVRWHLRPSCFQLTVTGVGGKTIERRGRWRVSRAFAN